ncbi:MAG: hypothetical protein ACLS3Y_01525 [Collinsella sp.]
MAFTVDIELDAQGRVYHITIPISVIRSRAHGLTAPGAAGTCRCGGVFGAGGCRRGCCRG